nr:hypothetical protein [Campylobacter sp.]
MIKFAQIFAKKSEIAQANFTQDEPKNLQNLGLDELKKLKICLILQFCVVAVFSVVIWAVFIKTSLLNSVMILLNLAYVAFAIVFLIKIYQFFVISKFVSKFLWIKYLFGVFICIGVLYLMNDFLYTNKMTDLYNKNKFRSIIAVIIFCFGFALVFYSYKTLKYKKYFLLSFGCFALILVPDFVIFISYIFADFNIYKIIFEIIISGLSVMSLFFVLKLGFFIYAPILILINILLEFLAYNK